MTINSQTICVVYVTYHPNIDLLHRSLQSLSSQVDQVIVVDNSVPSISTNLLSLCPNATVIPLNDNVGIAKAQNIGIQKAQTFNADYVVLSDQDTLYPDNYIEKMLSLFSDEKIAAIGPVFFNANTKEYAPFVESAFPFIKKTHYQTGLHSVKQLIASGKVIRISTLKTIGNMDEQLFIDWVDLEWCWRAIKKGYRIMQTADVLIQHQLGEWFVQVGNKIISARSPIRQYYIVRNSFYLSLYCDSLTVIEKSTLFLKSILYWASYPILLKPHWANLKMVCAGLWDGITKQLGKKK